MNEKEKIKNPQRQLDKEISHNNKEISYNEFEYEEITRRKEEKPSRSATQTENKTRDVKNSIHAEFSIVKPMIISKFPMLEIARDNISIKKSVDKIIINEIIVQTFGVPNFPLINLRVTRKSLDTQTYLVSVKFSEKEPSLPTVPKIYVSAPIPVKLIKDISSGFKLSEIIPKIPSVLKSDIHIKSLCKKNHLISEKTYRKTSIAPHFPINPKSDIHIKFFDKKNYLINDESSRKVSTMPDFPIISRLNIYMKLLDKKNHLISEKTYRKELSAPNIPKLNINFTLIKLDKNVNIVLDNEIKTPLPRVLQKASIKIGIKSLDKIIFIEQLLKSESEEILTKGAKNNKAVITSEVSNLPSSILTLLFESDDRKYSIEGLLGVKPDRPVIIVAIKSSNDDYIGTLISILREIYRMKVGGLPIVRYIGTIAEKSVAEDEPTRQGFIKVIDDSKSNILNTNSPNPTDYYKLRDRLIELSGQGLSFLVFYINEDKKDFLLSNLASLREKISPAKIIVIKPRKLNAEQKRELARATWGFVDPEEISDNATLDRQFKLREDEFNNILEKIATERGYAEMVIGSNEANLEEGENESESPLHYQLKAFIVRYFIEKEKIPKENIKTEYELPAEKIIPDVYVESKKLAIEVETFYGTGLTPWRKLENTIEKYVGNKEVNEVWIVIPPLQTMLYLKDLVSKIKNLKEKGYGNFIKFYTVDLSETKLITIKEISEKISEQFPKPM